MMEIPYYVANCDERGTGVFAAKTFSPGELILRFTGTSTPVEDIADFTHYLQISPNTFLGPSGLADDYVNHSCDPNCAVYLDGEAQVLRTLREISPDEQLCFDYGTILFSEPTLFDCHCGSEQCRGQIGHFESLPAELQAYYLSINAVPLLARYSMEELREGVDKNRRSNSINAEWADQMFVPAE